MIEARVRSALAVPPQTLTAFLKRNLSPSKAAFLEQHGDWWYRGQHNRWVIEADGEVAAYCAVIPTAMQVCGERVDAAWWVDLIVDSNHRGEGFQRAFDEKVRAAAPLIVGIPNALAARIHRRHGWGVRKNLEVLLLPFRPREIVKRRDWPSAKRFGLRVMAMLAEPVVAVNRVRLERFSPTGAKEVGEPSAEMLAGVFRCRQADASVTTERDESFIEWRYLRAPYRDELSFFVGGPNGKPSVCAVLRVMTRRTGSVARILDLFGDLADDDVVSDVIRLATQHALRRGVQQVTAMAANRPHRAQLRSAGFLARAPARFCWRSENESMNAGIAASPHHLVLGDSDNDEP